MMTTAAWVTLIFAIIEFGRYLHPEWRGEQEDPSACWTPVMLPPLAADTAPGGRPRTRGKAIAELVLAVVGVTWLLLIPRWPYLLLGPGAAYLGNSPFQPAPVLMVALWWVIGVNVFNLAWRGFALWRGTWRNARQPFEPFVNAIGLAPLLLLLSTPNRAFFILRHAALDQARYGGTLQAINHGIWVLVLFIFAITLLRLLWLGVQYGVDRYKRRLAAD